MRYAWDPGFFAGEQLGLAERAAAAAAASAACAVRTLIASARPDAYIANSRHVAARIRKYYRRDSTVIHPPVDVERFLGSAARGDDGYYLFLGRLVPYKRADLAVAACARLDRPLKVVGSGRGGETLGRAGRARAPSCSASSSDDDARARSSRARARCSFPGEEDFGMVPVEVQAAGVPVIAYGARRGGGQRRRRRDRHPVRRPGRRRRCATRSSASRRRASTRTSCARARATFSPERFRREISEFLMTLDAEE